MLESASDGWRLGNDLGSEAPGMLQQMTLQDAIHRLNEALTLEQILVSLIAVMEPPMIGVMEPV